MQQRMEWRREQPGPRNEVLATRSNSGRLRATRSSCALRAWSLHELSGASLASAENDQNSQ
eukprot:6506884-Alexandrium_andersonii.AAC.1